MWGFVGICESLGELRRVCGGLWICGFVGLYILLVEVVVLPHASTFPSTFPPFRGLPYALSVSLEIKLFGSPQASGPILSLPSTLFSNPTFFSSDYGIRKARRPPPRSTQAHGLRPRPSCLSPCHGTLLLFLLLPKALLPFRT